MADSRKVSRSNYKWYKILSLHIDGIKIELDDILIRLEQVEETIKLISSELNKSCTELISDDEQKR